MVAILAQDCPVSFSVAMVLTDLMTSIKMRQKRQKTETDVKH